MRVLRVGAPAVAALVVVWVGLTFLALRPPHPLPAPRAGFTLDRVTLIEPGSRRRESVRVVVEGARIARVEPGVADPHTRFLDAFVLPGLTDMHAHLPFTGLPGDDEYSLLLLLSHGVTTVRLLGGTDVEATDALRLRIRRGELAGPRLYTCGVWIDGPDPVLPGARSVRTPDEARAVVEELAEAGVDCIKPYDGLDLATTIALREAAHSNGLPVVGHTPQDVSLEDARLDDVQHLRGVHPPFEDEGRHYPQLLRPWLRLDEARLEHVIDVSLYNDMAYTPTLSAVEGTLRARDWAAWRESETMQSWLPHLRDGLFSAEVGLSPTRFMSDEDFEMVAAAFANMKHAVLRLYEAGIPMHTGTDCNAPNVVPGASLHRELRLLHEAGLTAEQALEASSVHSPAFLDVEDAGRLRRGAPADFAIFSEDPTRDLDALDSLVAVSRGGRLYTRSDLDERLARYRAHYEGGMFRTFVLAPFRVAMRAVSAYLRRPSP